MQTEDYYPETDCMECIHCSVSELEEPCWSCAYNALVGEATGNHFRPKEAANDAD